MLVAAFFALGQMTAHGGGAALSYGKECPFMTGEHPVAEPLQILCAMSIDDIGQCRHGLTGRPSVHSGSCPVVR